MTSWNPLLQMFLARLREFYREPETIFWVYFFPMIMAIGLGIAFAGKKPDPPVVDVQEGHPSAESVAELLKEHELTAEVHSEDECRKRLRTGKTALYLVVTSEGFTYAYDETRPECVQARDHVDAVLLRAKAGPAVTWKTENALVSEPGSRYIDFLMPGLLGLNLLGGGLWGVGYVVVDMRVRKLLKRYLATPMNRSHFLIALLASRLVMMIPEMALLLLFGSLTFGVPIRGGVGLTALTLALGAFAFAGLGLMLACRTEKTETIAGYINLTMLPMWMVSGTFFSSRRFPEAAQPVIQALPLTQLNDALREVMLEGATFSQVAWRLAILGTWAVVCYLIALYFFRWR